MTTMATPRDPIVTSEMRQKISNDLCYRTKIKMLDRLIATQCDRIITVAEIRKISENWMELNKLLRDETMQLYQKAKTLRRIHKDSEIQNNPMLNKTMVIRRDMYTDLLSYMLGKWKKNIRQQRAQGLKLNKKLAVLTKRENKIRIILNKEIKTYSETLGFPMIIPPSYLDNHLTMYNVPLSLRDHNILSPPASGSEEDDLEDE